MSTVMTSHTPAPLLVSIAEAAKLLNVSETLLRVAIRQAQVPCTRIGRRVLISRRTLEELASGERTIAGPVDTRRAG